MASKDERVYSQIEASADYYEPSIYSALGFTSLFQALDDPAKGDFIPLLSPSAYKLGEANATGHMFVVGLLPPTSNVTARPIDRSATVANLQGGVGAADLGSDDVTRSSGSGSLGDGFWGAFVQMANRLGVNPSELARIINLESGFNPAAEAPSHAKGLNQILPSTASALGMTDEEWATYGSLSGVEQLYWVEKSFKAAGVQAGDAGAALYRRNLGGYNNPDGSWWSTKASAEAYLQAHNIPYNPSDPNMGGYTNIATQTKAVLQNPAFVVNGTITAASTQAYLDKHPYSNASLNAALAAVGNARGSSGARPVGVTSNTLDQDNVTTSWKDSGAVNAQSAKAEEDKTAGQDLNRTDLGKSLLEAQNKMAKLVQQKLEVMRNTPPLRMLVNPESFKVAAEKIVSDGNWTRHGPIIEHCCDNQDKITGSGKVAGFYSVDAQNATGPGLARTTRNYSMAYQNFLSLWLLYRNNGGLLVPDSMTASESDPIDVLSVMGSIYIYYDGILYIGSFDSFNVNETDTVPFTLEYDFQFTVRAWYELDRSDPAQYQYGVSGMFKQGGIPVIPDTQKTYEAAQAAGAARKKEAEALAAERNKLDSLYVSPDQLYGGK